MCRVCVINASNWDMAPRISICQATNKPVAHFTAETVIIENYAKRYNKSVEEVTQLAYDYLQKLVDEKAAVGDIYYCEDYFYFDLEKYFTLLQVKPEVKTIPEEIAVINPEFIKNDTNTTTNNTWSSWIYWRNLFSTLCGKNKTRKKEETH